MPGYDFTAANASRDTLMTAALVAANDLASIVADLRTLGTAVAAARLAEQGSSVTLNLPADERALLHLVRSGQKPW